MPIFLCTTAPLSTEPHRHVWLPAFFFQALSGQTDQPTLTQTAQAALRSPR
jgi:hypothetical protein